MHYGLIGGAKEGWPIRPAYHVLRMFTHTTQPGWRAVRVEGMADELLASATRGRKGEISVYVLNRAAEVRVVRLRGLPAKVTHQLAWNGDGNGLVSATPAGAGSGQGDVVLRLPPNSVTCTTTLPIGVRP
jgi:hypothetical protein